MGNLGSEQTQKKKKKLNLYNVNVDDNDADDTLKGFILILELVL
jgi:hypothetical protein